MAVTPTQIEGVLSIKKAFNVITGQLTLTDQSPYTTALTLVTPWTIKGLFKIIDPTGATAYVNSGYNSDTYSSPDISITNASSGPYTLQFALPTVTGGGVMLGTYQVYYKLQVVENVGGTNTTTTYAALGNGAPDSAQLTQCYPSVATSEQFTDCNTAVVKNTDTTSYGQYSTLSRVHKLIPPSLSGQPTQTTSATSITYSSVPYTGTWAWSIASTVTYYTGNNVYITALVSGESEFVIICDTNWCKLLCLVRKYYNDYFSDFGKVATKQDARNWLLVMSNFEMAYHSQLCGKSDSEIQVFIDAIYAITGLSKDCDCGCSDKPTPIVPTNIINGAPGENGTNGISPALRVSGGYVQVSYDNSATWSNLFLIVNGANGADGAPGANGTTLLYGDPASYSTNTTGSAQLLNMAPILGTTFNAVGTTVEFYTVFTAANGPLGSQQWEIIIGDGVNQIDRSMQMGVFPGGNNIAKVEVSGKIMRSNSNTVQVEMSVQPYSKNGSNFASQQIVNYPKTAILSLDFTSAMSIKALGNVGVLGQPVTEEFMEVYLLKE